MAYSIHLVTDGKTIEKRLLRMFDKIDKAINNFDKMAKALR